MHHPTPASVWWMWSAPCRWNRPQAPASGLICNRPPASACCSTLRKSQPWECQNGAYGPQYRAIQKFRPNWKSTNKNRPLSPCPNHHGLPRLRERNWLACPYWPKLRQFYYRYVPTCRRPTRSRGLWFAKWYRPHLQNQWANPPPFYIAHPPQSKSHV